MIALNDPFLKSNNTVKPKEMERVAPFPQTASLQVLRHGEFNGETLKADKLGKK